MISKYEVYKSTDELIGKYTELTIHILLSNFIKTIKISSGQEDVFNNFEYNVFLTEIRTPPPLERLLVLVLRSHLYTL